MKKGFTSSDLIIFKKYSHILTAGPFLSAQLHSGVLFWSMDALFTLCFSCHRVSLDPCPPLWNVFIFGFHHYRPMGVFVLSCLKLVSQNP